MQLEQITMDRNKAREAFLQYRRAVRDRHNAEDEQIMRGYRALAGGHQLIHLPNTLRAGGVEPKRIKRRQWSSQQERLMDAELDVFVPKLAAIRADARAAFTQGITRDGGCTITADRVNRELADRNRKDRLQVPDGTFAPDANAQHGWRDPYWKSIVPIVPPPLRPAHSLRNYVVLWEATWEAFSPPRPPGDPALLKHVGGALYAVVAVWDLSELERAVLAVP